MSRMVVKIEEAQKGGWKNSQSGVGVKIARWSSSRGHREILARAPLKEHLRHRVW